MVKLNRSSRLMAITIPVVYHTFEREIRLFPQKISLQRVLHAEPFVSRSINHRRYDFAAAQGYRTERVLMTRQESFRLHGPSEPSRRRRVLHRIVRAEFKAPKTTRRFFIPLVHRQHRRVRHYRRAFLLAFFSRLRRTARAPFLFFLWPSALVRPREHSRLFHFGARGRGFKCKFRACRRGPRAVDHIRVSPGRICVRIAGTGGQRG